MLEVRHLRKQYKTKNGVVTKALDDVSLTFAETGMVFILGKSGSGKSTLLNVCGGLDKADSGEIIIKGKSSAEFSGQDFDSYRNTYVGFVFQEYNILEEFTVEENIALALELQNKKRDKAVIEKILADVDMTNFASRKPNTLSGGQKQRVAIARALVKEPEIIMADEPTGALDSKTGQQVFDTLKKLSETKLVIVISHDRDFAEQYGDRIIELKDGKVISDQTRAEEGEGARNVRFFGTDTVCVARGAELTDADMLSIRQFLNKSGGAAVISTSRERISEMKQDLPELSVGAFEDLKEQPLSKAYPQQKLIRSHLPARHAIRMGGSSLKTKPVRLVFTIFLSVIAFILFGLASTLMLFDGKSVTKETLGDVGDAHIILSKAYYETNKGYENGELTWEEEYKRRTGYTVDEYNELKTKYPGAIAAADVSISLYNNLSITQAAEQYYTTYLDGVILNDSSLVYASGRAPEKIDEVAISDYILDMMMLPKAEFSYYKVNEDKSEERVQLKVTKAADIIYSETNPVTITMNSVPYKITGVYKGMEVPETYRELKEAAERDTQFTGSDEVRWYWQDVRSNGMYAKLAVSQELMEKLAKSGSGNDNFDFGKYFNYGISSVTVGVKSTENEDAYGISSSYLAKYESSDKPLLKVYDFDGNELTSLSAGKIALSYKGVAGAYNSIYDNNYWKLQQEYEKAMQDAADAANEEYTNAHPYPQSNDFVDQDAYQAAEEKYNSDRNAAAQAAYDKAYADYPKVTPEPKREDFKSDEEYQNELAEYNQRRANYADDARLDAFNNYGSEHDRPQYYDFVDQDAYRAAINRYNAELNEAVETARINASGKLKPYLQFEKRVKDAALAAFVAENPEPEEMYGEQWYEWSNKRDNAVNEAWSAENPFSRLNQMAYNGDAQFEREEIFSILKGARDLLSQMGLLDDLIVYGRYDSSEAAVDIAGFYMESARYSESGIYMASDLYDKFYIQNSSSNYNNVTETKYVEREGAFISAVYIPNNGASTIDELVDLTYVRNDDDSSVMIANSVMRSLEMVISMVDVLSFAFLIAGIVLAVFSFLLMFNFISASITAKKKEIGILRAIGARTTDVFKIFLSEAMIIALICFAISTAGTLATCILLNGMLVDTAIQVSMFVFGPISVLCILGIALLTAIVSTVIPVGLYSRKPPVASIRAL